MRYSKRGKIAGILKWLGVLLILAAGVFSFYNYRQASAAAARSHEVLMEMELLLPDPTEVPAAPTMEVSVTVPALPPEIEPVPDYVLYPDMEMPRLEIDGHDYIGVLEIPSLELSLPVMSDWDYDKLKIAPCRYSGSAYKNSLVIAAHNYAQHFGQLSSLSYGDEITFTDLDGNLFRYEVLEIETLQPHAIDYMEDYNPGLSLFTCTIGGEKRLTIRAIALE